MRQIRNFQKQISLLLLGSRRSLVKIDNFVADFPDTGFEVCRCPASGAFCADLFAQASALRVQVLQSGLEFSAFAIGAKYFVNFPFVATTPRCQPLSNKIRLLPDQMNVEHGGTVAAAVWAAQRKRGHQW